MEARQLWFTAEKQVDVIYSDLPALASNEILVDASCSAISAGTELLVYRNQFPKDLPLDATLDSLGSDNCFQYPLRYGYATVGQVSRSGEAVDPNLIGRPLFAFQPHASRFVIKASDGIFLPTDISLEDALFLPNMETAVNLVQDGRPLLGERVMVIGCGVVGLLTISLLAQFPLKQLVAVDLQTARLEAASNCGAELAARPEEMPAPPEAFDLVFELSGNPNALDTALQSVGYGGRIVIGSWYGEKRAPINLGGRFHRNRIRLISSQVSTIDPELSGRWDKERRFNVVLDQIREIGPSKWISHRYSLEDAQSAYARLDQGHDNLLQVIFEY
ncbi:MAG: zinc-binding alcohol dehydrogenase [Chloroflexota bacterium]